MFHLPSAFNSAPVLPPCLRRRSAVSLYAALLGHKEIAELLIAKGVDVNRGLKKRVGLTRRPRLSFLIGLWEFLTFYRRKNSMLLLGVGAF